MRGRRALAALAVLLGLSAQGAEAQAPAASAGQVLTFTEEVPCPPTSPTAPARVHRVRHRSPRRRPVVHKAVAPVHRTVHRVLAKHPVRRRRPALVRAAAPVAPTRCSVVRRERLTTASFGITPETAELTPIVADIEPGGPALAALTSGRPAFPNVVNPTAGGGGQPGSPGGVGSVSAAPEPGQWVLLMFGVGAMGFALRRRSKAAKVS